MKKLLLSLLLAVVFAVPAFAQGMDMPMKEHRGGHGPMMGMGNMGNMDKMGEMMGMCLKQAEKLGLTDEQIAKMKPLHREMQKSHARFVADMKIAEIEMMEIMDVKDFDLDKANAACKKMAELKTAHHLEMLKSMKEMRTILTDEQFKEMKKLHMTRGERKGGKRMRNK
jgi:Spy/CpxP family protein refolding chaperone